MPMIMSFSMLGWIYAVGNRGSVGLLTVVANGFGGTGREGFLRQGDLGVGDRLLLHIGHAGVGIALEDFRGDDAALVAVNAS